jgi:hypothetical protein
MTGPEIQATYFSPFHFLMYLILIFVAMVVYYQWQWSKRCNKEVRVWIVQPDGSADTAYAPKTGSYVSLKVPDSNSTRLWPINKLSTIETLYPGDGFIPRFLQKKIKTVIVDSEDWEPLLNRGSYTRMVASPDVVRALRDLGDEYPEAHDELNDLADGLSTAPTRDMVASPIVLGNVMKEKVSELAVTISKDSLDLIPGLAKKLDKVPSPMVTYIGFGAIIAILIVFIVLVIPNIGGETNLSQVAQDINAIKRALGIP